MKRVPPSERLREEVFGVLQQGAEGGSPLRAFIRQAARYVLQVAVEQEVTEFLGRGHYQRGERQREGWRNGYEPKRLRSEAGVLEIALPQVRGTEESFRSQLAVALGARRTAALERLVTGMYVRGLSTRDVEALLAETYGQPVLSRSGVSAVSEQLSSDFERWRSRDLRDLKVVYLFLDAIYLPVRQGTDEKEGVLAAYGILEDGRKVLLHVALGSRESYDAWLGFLHNMTARGLTEPVLVISDGNPGLRKAVREVFPHALRQRCQVHKMRNLLAKLPRAVQAQMKRLIQKVFWADTYKQGLERGRALIARFQSRFPAAMECLEKDLEECLTYLKLPPDHHLRIRTTNLLERTFGEGRRRTKVIPRFPTEKACLKLVYATLLTASKSWRGVRMTPKILREIDRVRAELGMRDSHHGALAA